MQPPKPATWTYAEDYIREDEVLAAARARSEEVGVVPIGSGGGAALRLLAAVIEARAVVEIGTGTGVSGVWMLRGMRPDGVLTTVDIEAEHQRLAREWRLALGCPVIGITGSTGKKPGGWRLGSAARPGSPAQPARTATLAAMATNIGKNVV